MNHNKHVEYSYEHMVYAIARIQQSAIMLQAIIHSDFVDKPLINHIREVTYRELFVDLYLLFDKSNKHLSLERLLKDNKNKINNSIFVEASEAFTMIQKDYVHEIEIINCVGNAIIRHIDKNKMDIIYGSKLGGQYGLDLVKIYELTKEVSEVLTKISIFNKNIFDSFNEIISVDQIIDILNLNIDDNRLNLLHKNFSY